jgi:hypothetical protein
MATVWLHQQGIENPDSQMGCYACQPEDYDRFKPFFSKALAKCAPSSVANCR